MRHNLLAWTLFVTPRDIIALAIGCIAAVLCVVVGCIMLIDRLWANYKAKHIAKETPDAPQDTH